MTGEPVAAAATAGAGTAEPLALETRALEIRYHGRRLPALSGINLAVGRGELVGVAGRNGAGKSTLALVAGGLIPRVVRARLGGHVAIGGRAAVGAPPEEFLGQVGVVFSTPSNQLSGAKTTVREELAFGLENLGVERQAMDGRIDATLEALGISHLAERPPAALSGGEQQRVAIAAILCMGPRLVVLDEPTAHLDPAATRAVADLLDGQAASGRGVLVAEHRSSVLERARRCLVLDGGAMVGTAIPAIALGPQLGGRVGVAVPALAALAAALGVEAERGLDVERVVEAIRAAGPDRLLRAAAEAGGDGDTRAASVATWESFREQVRASIEVRGLRHTYPDGTEALRGVDLVIGPGETVAIVGQNGSGKTTLAKHLVRILAPSGGSVRVGGEDLAGRTIAEAARTVGFVFQDPDRQLFSRSVESETAFGPRNLGFADGQVRRLVAQALATVGLGDRATENPYDLGQSDRRLVALASVLAMDPPILVLDEPTTGQDAPGVARLGAIVDAWARAGRTVIAITHDMEFAARHFRRVVVMRGGEVVEDGPPATVLSAANAGPLASTGLEPSRLALLAERLGVEGVPRSAGELLARVAWSCAG